MGLKATSITTSDIHSARDDGLCQLTPSIETIYFLKAV